MDGRVAARPFALTLPPSCTAGTLLTATVPVTGTVLATLALGVLVTVTNIFARA